MTAVPCSYISHAVPCSLSLSKTVPNTEGVEKGRQQNTLLFVLLPFYTRKIIKFIKIIN